MKKVLFILGQLTDDDINWMAHAGTKRVSAAGTHLISEGTRVSEITILLSGEAAVTIGDEGRTIATIGAGEIIGEISLVDQRPATASVVCRNEVTSLAISHAAIHAKFEQDTPFAARFFRAISMFMADRMRSTVMQLGVKTTQATSVLDDLDELDEDVLNNVHLAGKRFEMIIDILSK